MWYGTRGSGKGGAGSNWGGGTSDFHSVELYEGGVVVCIVTMDQGHGGSIEEAKV